MRRAIWLGHWVGLLALIACGDVEANPTAIHCSTTSPCPDQLVCYRELCIENVDLPGDLDDAGLNSEATAPVDDAGDVAASDGSASPTMTGASSPAPMSSTVDASQPAPSAPSTPSSPPTSAADAGPRPAPADAAVQAPATPVQPRAEDLVQCLGPCTIGNLLSALRLDSDGCQRCLARVSARCNPAGDGGEDDDNARRCRNER